MVLMVICLLEGSRCNPGQCEGDDSNAASETISIVCSALSQSVCNSYLTCGSKPMSIMRSASSSTT